jgi:hypothetical protein
MVDNGFDSGPRIFATGKRLWREVEGERAAFDTLGIKKEEVYNKSVFEIGLGAGASLKQVDRHNRLNPKQQIHYVGTDVLLQIPDDKLTDRNRYYKMELQLAAQTYPLLFQSSNVAYGIQQPDNAFDYVISNHCMPEYANNPTEVINIIFEMMRVAKTKVAFNAGWELIDDQGLGTGIYKLGGDDRLGPYFTFRLQKLIEELRPAGITNAHKPFIHIQLHTTNKDLKKLGELRKDILNRLEEFS